MAYYGDPTMAPTVFLEAYIQSTTEEFRRSEDAPNIDAKNPAGWLFILKVLEAFIYLAVFSRRLYVRARYL